MREKGGAPRAARALVGVGEELVEVSCVDRDQVSVGAQSRDAWAGGRAYARGSTRLFSCSGGSVKGG